MKLINLNLNELEKYARLEGSEIGKLCVKLIQLWQFRSHFLSPEFIDSVEKEMLYQLENFKWNTQIIKKTYTTKQTYEELEWKIER